MPREVKDPTQGINVDSLILENDKSFNTGDNNGQQDDRGHLMEEMEEEHWEEANFTQLVRQQRKLGFQHSFSAE